jgi:hypothetical protein
MNVHPPTASPSRFLSTPEPAGGKRTQSAQQQQSESRPELVKASLWEILTPEERAFFENQASMGPMTYRANGDLPQSGDVPTGRRIDVRG